MTGIGRGCRGTTRMSSRASPSPGASRSCPASAVTSSGRPRPSSVPDWWWPTTSRRRSITCPRAGELIAVDDLVLNIGGGAANTAVDLARLGVRAAICARVGDDIFGRFATETLLRRGVDCSAPEGRSQRADQPDPDRQRPGRGSAVHPRGGGQPGLRRRRPRRRAGAPAARPAHRLFPDPAQPRRPRAWPSDFAGPAPRVR